MPTLNHHPGHRQLVAGKTMPRHCYPTFHNHVCVSLGQGVWPLPPVWYRYCVGAQKLLLTHVLWVGLAVYVQVLDCREKLHRRSMHCTEVHSVLLYQALNLSPPTHIGVVKWSGSCRSGWPDQYQGVCWCDSTPGPLSNTSLYHFNLSADIE